MPSILLIEDDGAMSNAYYMVLTKQGYDVHQASDGQQGLQLAEQLRPNIIILDMLMPGMSGLDFLRQLNLPVNLPETKLIVLSNVESPKVIEETKQLGASHYLLKINYTPNELMQFIQGIDNGNAGTSDQPSSSPNPPAA